MLAPAIGLALDECRPTVVDSHVGDGIQRNLADLQNITIGHLMRRNTISPDSLAELTGSPSFFDWSVDRKPIVLTYEKYRQAVQRSKIQTFVENTLFGGAV